MSNHAATYCRTLDTLDRAAAVNAAHQALCQLEAIGERCEGAKGQTMDNRPAIAALRAVMRAAGHIGFAPDTLADNSGEKPLTNAPRVC